MRIEELATGAETWYRWVANTGCFVVNIDTIWTRTYWSRIRTSILRQSMHCWIINGFEKICQIKLKHLPIDRPIIVEDPSKDNDLLRHACEMNFNNTDYVQEIGADPITIWWAVTVGNIVQHWFILKFIYPRFVTKDDCGLWRLLLKCFSFPVFGNIPFILDLVNRLKSLKNICSHRNTNFN